MSARRGPKQTAKRTFSAELEEWLESRGKKTIQGLLHEFQEKSFAILCLLLMSIPALPLPTGGVTHVFEIIVMLLALEMIIGRRTPWLPKRALRHELGPATQKKAIPFIVRRVRWFEKHSRHRLSGLLRNRLTLSVLGFVILGFALTAFLSPPFSGLDTVPSLGVVILALGLILEDALLMLAGIVVGAAGVALVIAIGSAAAHFLF
jgi:hypothetical protein